MNRLEAMRRGGGTLISVTAGVPGRAGPAGVPLPEFGFAAGIGGNRALGVLFDEPVLIVQDGNVTKRRIIPRAELRGDDGWRSSVQPSAPPTTVVSGAPSSDVSYGKIPDRATAMCRATAGAYVAMLAFPTVPYLVHYDVDRDRFRTYALRLSQPVMVLFERPGRLHYILAGSADVLSVEAATS